MAKTRKVKSAGRFRVGYGKTIREKISIIEEKQRKKQKCPFCKKLTVKRLSKSIWYCKKCGKKFTSNTYYVD